ncbi:MAG: helix-hairpin-helix domain-containing protein [Bacteroidetes bacterium]|nr:helix-hairpin-helix domain-containing protein [Bacteroidota bacterium]MDA0902890.1 helix-hairpin-helix domain-containing protein [Bacteroidota bacterium]MDA1241957.1 helix-hairpin-helix domain-containing protein [Bacteroidota bacterium]
MSWRARLAQTPHVGVEELLDELSGTHVPTLTSRPRATVDLFSKTAASKSGPLPWGAGHRPTHRKNENRVERVVPSKISLNASTAEDWDQLPGIGPVLSQRIVAYRNSIGGFSSISQLHHVYGLDSATMEVWSSRIDVDASRIQGKCVDSLTFRWLARHPAFGPEPARRLLSARGRGVTDLEVLRQRLRADSADWQNWLPYLLACPPIDSLD